MPSARSASSVTSPPVSAASCPSTKLVPWFYRILNNAVIDHYRKKGTERKYMDQYGAEVDTRVEPEDEATICACFRKLIPTLKPEYVELIETMELDDEDSEAMAERFAAMQEEQASESGGM